MSKKKSKTKVVPVTPQTYAGKIDVEVELPPEARVAQPGAALGGQVSIELWQRLVATANQLGLQGRVLEALDLHPPIVDYRRTASLQFRQVSDVQLHKIRAGAKKQAAEQLRQSGGDNEAGERSSGDDREESGDPRDRKPSILSHLREQGLTSD